MHADPSYQGPIPNLDGCEGHSEHIMFGSNVDITPSEEAGQEDHVTTGQEEVVSSDVGSNSEQKQSSASSNL